MSQAVIGNLQVRMGLDSAEFANGVRSVQGSLATLGSSLKAFATATAAVTVFQQAVTALRDVADLGDVADAIGVTAEQLQVYQRMALASGASSEVMMRGLQSIAEQSVDTKSKLAELFAANNMTLAGKEMNQIILEFMTLLENARTPAEQLAIATEVLGTKVGRQLVEALRVGASGWDTEFGNMRQSGNYLAEESVKDAAKIEQAYNQAAANIQTVWQRMVVAITSGFMKGGGYAVSPELRAQFQQFADARDGVTTAPGKGDLFTGKGDLPSNINSRNGYSIGGGGTANPFGGGGGGKTGKPGGIAAPGSLDDIYGPGMADSLNETKKSFDELWSEMESGIPTTNLVAESFQNIADTISNTLGYALEGLISGTMSVKDAFKSMAQSISQQLSQLAAELIKSSILKFIGIAAGGMGGFTVGGMSFGGFYANGGHLGSGQWGIAGENGPEIIRGPANIVPMDQMGSASPQMNVTVINNSQASVNTRQNQNGSLEVLIEDMIADKLTRGGNKIDTALARGYGLRRAGR